MVVMSLVTLVTTAELAGRAGVKRPGPAWVICDCRFSLADPGAGERAYRAGHIPGARYVHLERDLSGPVTADSGRHPLPERAALAERFGAWGISVRTQVVAYDDSGGAIAARLWWLLRWLGHERVAVLDGGWERWREEGRPVSVEIPRPHPALFEVRPGLARTVSAAEVAAGLARNEICLMDARSAERFRGEAESLDTVAGHVPGAVNRPYQDNLGPDGRFLPPAELRRALERRTAGFPPRQVVHMCGSGVTACHNLLAMEVAGLPGSGLYAGSWSEWIRDPARPVTRGTEGPEP